MELKYLNLTFSKKNTKDTVKKIRVNPEQKYNKMDFVPNWQCNSHSWIKYNDYQLSSFIV